VQSMTETFMLLAIVSRVAFVKQIGNQRRFYRSREWEFKVDNAVGISLDDIANKRRV
jgi:hypothetical protein